MRIFFVTIEYIDSETFKVIDGGLANYLYKITHVLSELGHDVNVVVTDTKNKHIVHENINVFYIKPKKFRLMRFLSKFTGKEKFKRVRAQLTVKEFLKKENKRKKIDIVQYASVLYPGLYPIKSIPSCVRISSYVKTFQECYGYSDELEVLCETEMFKKHRFIFGPSRHMADLISSDLKLKNEIKIIETPFTPKNIAKDTDYINKIKEQTKDKPYLLFFGTLGLLKGCREIADSIYNILSSHPDLFFVLVGKQVPIDGILPIDLIKDSAKEHQDRVIYFDKMQHNCLYPIIEDAKACIMPSRTENFSNTCIEAMALRKIVVGTKPFFNQIIQDGQNGFLCEAKNPASLKETIDKIMNLTDAECMNIEEKAYNTILRLEPNEIANQLLLYYDYVIKNWK